MEEVYPNSSGLDVHKRFVMACVYEAQESGRKVARKQRFETTTKGLAALCAWLVAHEVTHVVMESTGVYWKPVYNVLHAHFETWVVNARHLAQVPGRKTDATDAEWLTKLMCHGLLTPSFIPDVEQRDLRDLTRYRTRLQQEKSRTVNRLHKILEDANIKLASVVTDIQGVSARLMIEAMIADELTPSDMAELAKGSLRPKIPQLVEALTGHVRGHHRYMMQELLMHLDHLNRCIGHISEQIAQGVAPYESLIVRLGAIPGVGRHTAEIILAEIGPSVEKWPSEQHLASWACLCPGNNISGGKRRSGRRREGRTWLVSALVEAAWSASRTKATFLSARFHRLRARRGPQRAAVAVAHSILKIVYHLIRDPEATFTELGGDYFLNKRKEQEQRRAVNILTSLGFKVELEPMAA